MDSRPSFNISNNVAHATSQQIITTYYDPNGHNASVQACLRALDCPDVDAVRTEIHSLDGVIPECIAWIFQDDRFLQWKEQEGNAILWIYGSPGKGKTRMAAGIVDKLRKETSSPGVNGLTGFFFCQSTDDRMNNAVDVLKGIIRTIWEQRQSLKEHVHHHWIKEEQKFDRDLNQVASLWNLLKKMTKDIGHQATYIVIDAIDECSEQVEHLLRLIHTAGLVSPPNVKWLITSRPSSLDLQGSIWSYHRPMQIDLDSFTVQVDDAVQRYIKVKTAWMELSRFPVGDQARICKLLLTKSESTFLWVAFVCQEVRNLPAYEVVRVISAMPKGLHYLYEKNMQLLDQACHDGNEFAIDYRKLVWTLYSLSGSPHLLELAVLAGLPTEKASDESYLIRVIRECNTFMVLTESDAVMLVHKSVKDYLDKLQSTRSQLVKSQTHGALARRCIQILRRSLYRNLTELRELDSEANEANLELQTRFSSIAGYSCVHWIEHVVKESKDGISGPITLQIFLRQHLLHWLEAISILGRYRTCLEHLIHLDRTLEASSNAQNATPPNASSSLKHMRMAGLHESIKNIRDFVTASRHAIERWPLQVYSSALVFFTSGNGLDKVFHADKPDWILRCLTPRHHAWDPTPSVTLEPEHNASMIALSRDGEYLVTSANGPIQVWPLKQAGRFLELKCVTFRTEQDLLARRLVIEGSEVKISWLDVSVSMLDRLVIRSATWDLHSGEPIGEGFHPVVVYPLKTSHHFNMYVASAPAYVAELSNPTFADIPELCFSPDYELFATVDAHAEIIRTWSASDGEALCAVNIIDSLDVADLSGTQLFLTFCYGNRLIVYQAHNIHRRCLVVCVIKTLEILVRIDDLETDFAQYGSPWALDVNGDYLAYTTGVKVHVLKIATNRVVQTILSQDVTELALSTAPLRVAAGVHDGTVRIWDVDSERQRNLEHESSSTGCTSELEGSNESDYLRTDCWLPSPDNNKLVFLYIRDDLRRRSYYLDNAFTLAYAFSPDSRMFAVCFHSVTPDVNLCLDGRFGPDLSESPSTAFRLQIASDSSIKTSGVCFNVFTLWENRSYDPLPRTPIQCFWRGLEIDQKWMMKRPLSVATAFSGDQTLLLYSVADEDSITVGTIDIHERRENHFTFTLPDGQHGVIPRSCCPQAICTSADHRMVATSASINAPCSATSNIFIFRDSLHYLSAVAFANQGVVLMSFSKSATLLVAVPERGRIKVFKLPTHLHVASTSSQDSMQDLYVVAQFSSRRRRITNIGFSEDGRSLQTNIGQIPIFPDPGLAQCLKSPTLRIDDHWICMEEKRLVYFPPEYRPHGRLDILPFPYNSTLIFQDSCIWINTRAYGLIKIELNRKLIHRLICDGKLV